MAEALGGRASLNNFAEFSAQMTVGWRWWPALALSLIYFYGHYCFASIQRMLWQCSLLSCVVVLGAGAPPYVAVLVLAYFSNLSASLTHYGTTPGPIYFGAGYVSQQTWWRIGLMTSIPNILVWSIIGMLWWKLLGLW
jgi:DASS family divalent anion:Na+ symporter